MHEASLILATVTSASAAPLRLQFVSIPVAALIFLLAALPVILLGWQSLTWLSSARKWLAISLRLCVIWVLVLLICGAEWTRPNRDVEVVVLRDVSNSTSSVTPPPGRTLQQSVDELITGDCKSKRPGDRIGIVGFSDEATVESPPDSDLRLSAHPIQTGGDGTNIASALRLGLASFHEDAMHRLVLVSDGNRTQGDTDSAISAAAAMGVPIDVLPLHYEIRHDVLMDRIIARAVGRIGEPLSLDVILRSTSLSPVSGTISILEQNLPLQLPQHVQLTAGENVVHVDVPPATRGGLEQFRAVFQADNATDDTVTGNNSAEALTFIQGKGQVLYVDGESASAGGDLLDALHQQNIDIPRDNHITPENFPTRLIDLEPYDAILLANIPRGPGGLTTQQDRLLAKYVRDLGGGIVMIGGPRSFGVGNWQGSELEKVLPVTMDIPAERVMPAGAMVLVLDHSGSMSDAMPGDSDITKEQAATDAAIAAINSLQPEDLLGVVGFADRPQWIVNLSPNSNPDRSARRIRGVPLEAGTNICPALEEACAALEKIPSAQISTKRILLLTDGVSEGGDYDRLLARLSAAHITLSTIAVGEDADHRLLTELAKRGGGAAYSADSAAKLPQIFLQEARMLRRQLIQEPPEGIDLVQSAAAKAMPPLAGMVLTSLKHDPNIAAPILAAGKFHDPVLASWQAGLGHAAVFTADATSRWAPQWVASPAFGKFWAEVLRTVQRPASSGDFDVTTVRNGATTKVVIEAINHDGAATSFLRFAGRLSGPDSTEPAVDFTAEQTGPGRYEATLATPQSGNYAAVIRYSSAGNVNGLLLAGISIPPAVEFRDLQSNDAYLAEIAARTGGRVLPPLDRAGAAGLFDREGLPASMTIKPINDLLISLLLALLIADVAVRRISWDWNALKRSAWESAAMVQSFTSIRQIDARPTLAALRKVHDSTVEKKNPRIDAAIQFESRQVVVTPLVHERVTDSTARSSLGSLKAAKLRAMAEIRRKEEIGHGDTKGTEARERND